MAVLRSIIFAAAASGMLVGLLISAAQQFGTVPLIARGEIFERAASPQAAAAVPAGQAQSGAGHSHAGVGHAGVGHAGAGHGAVPHDHGAAPSAGTWEPRDGFERSAYTVLFNILDRIGFALMLAGGLVLSGRPPGWREGFLWGLAGFVVFSLSPGLSLPPELPGSPEAALGARQIWWVATALCTGAGLWLILFKRSAALAALAVALLVGPHLVGAPMPPDQASVVPAALAHRFVVVVLMTTLLSWALLGALTGYFSRRFLAAEPG